MDEKVYCQTCVKGYPKYSDNQGENCASDVYFDILGDRYVLCQYGSDYDTGKYLVSPKSEVRPGLICDNCIAAEIEKKHIFKDEKFDYFHALSKPVIDPLWDDWNVIDSF